MSCLILPEEIRVTIDDDHCFIWNTRSSSLVLSSCYIIASLLIYYAYHSHFPINTMFYTDKTPKLSNFPTRGSTVWAFKDINDHVLYQSTGIKYKSKRHPCLFSSLAFSLLLYSFLRCIQFWRQYFKSYHLNVCTNRRNWSKN